MNAQEGGYVPPFKYEFSQFREHMLRWLYRGATPDCTKAYLQEFYPAVRELEWKHARFYEALAYTEALLKQYKEELSDYWYPMPGGIDKCYLSGYLVLAVWQLMAHVPNGNLFKYPSLDQVQKLAHSYWMGAIENMQNPSHLLSPEIVSAGPPRFYGEEEFQTDLYQWLEQQLDVEEMKLYFLFRYTNHNEALWKLRRVLVALSVLRDRTAEFPEFTQYDLALIKGLWRYLSVATYAMIAEPDVETIRYLALAEKKYMELE